MFTRFYDQNNVMFEWQKSISTSMIYSIGVRFPASFAYDLPPRGELLWLEAIFGSDDACMSPHTTFVLHTPCRAGHTSLLRFVPFFVGLEPSPELWLHSVLRQCDKYERSICKIYLCYHIHILSRIIYVYISRWHRW